MQKIWQGLREIQTLLEQIESITQNQTTVLLESANGVEGINILEQMFEYKSFLMGELERIEGKFQENYKGIREELEGSRELTRLKNEVAIVLKIKENIVQIEQKNTLLMNAQKARLTEKIQIPCMPGVVIAAYQKQNKK